MSSSDGTRQSVSCMVPVTSKDHTGNGVIKGLLGEMASLVGRVEDLIVEDREVQGQAKTDRVSRGEVGLGHLGGVLVGLERLLGRVLPLFAGSELGQVAMIVTLPAMRSPSAAVDEMRSTEKMTYILW